MYSRRDMYVFKAICMYTRRYRCIDVTDCVAQAPTITCATCILVCVWLYTAIYMYKSHQVCRAVANYVHAPHACVHTRARVALHGDMYMGVTNSFH